MICFVKSVVNYLLMGSETKLLVTEIIAYLRQPLAVVVVFLGVENLPHVVALELHVHHRQVVEDEGDLVLLLLLKIDR